MFQCHDLAILWAIFVTTQDEAGALVTLKGRRLNQVTKDRYTRSVTLSETKGLSERFFAPLRMTIVKVYVVKCLNAMWIDLG